MYENLIEKAISNYIHGFKTKNNHTTKSRSGMLSWKFPSHAFNCSERNNRQLEESFFMYASCSL